MNEIQDLIEIFINEKSCKSFLPFEYEVVDYFYKRILNQREKLESCTEPKIVKSIMELDIDRVEYLLKEYILIRLNKLKTNFFVDSSLLSDGEKDFYFNYLKLFQEEDILDNEIESKKHEEEVVGFVCKAKSINIILDGEHIEIFQGDFFVTEIKNIFDLIKSKQVRLV
ncbi:DNA replication complex GINS protein sld5 [Nosema granulosis]|uniref:DNA replication complex GINS protein SLD5 n=1 Tax=Nosema granulosis TaxID=83296 RepID=A0A9P6H2M2_9MICR|nr:DNA replication complex GINS protein sld5 [Nosema granulosis]